MTLVDYKIIKKVIKHNAREPMPLYDPYDMKWDSKRKSDYFPEKGAGGDSSVNIDNSHDTGHAAPVDTHSSGH